MRAEAARKTKAADASPREFVRDPVMLEIRSDRLEHNFFRNVAGAERLFEVLDPKGQRFQLRVRRK